MNASFWIVEKYFLNEKKTLSDKVLNVANRCYLAKKCPKSKPKAVFLQVEYIEFRKEL